MPAMNESAAPRCPRLRRLGRVVVRLLAALTLVQLYVALLGVPGFIAGWFMCVPPAGQPAPPPPRYLVCLGGGGIPSESGLIRCYATAELWRKYPESVCVVSLPSDGDPATNSVGRMRDELVMRGVPAAAVRMEWRAVNTHEQAVNVAALLGPEGRTSEVRLVTSPWHLRRSLASFRRAGFTNVRVESAASVGAEADPGGGLLLRYGVWYNAQSGIECAREAVALLIYRLRGWI